MVFGWKVVERADVSVDLMDWTCLYIFSERKGKEAPVEIGIERVEI
jgi:hypothetical protein